LREEGKKKENNAIVESPGYVRSFPLITLRCIHELVKKKMIGSKTLIAESGHGESDSPFGHSGVKKERKK